MDHKQLLAACIFVTAISGAWAEQPSSRVESATAETQETPHQYLQRGFQTRAIELMKADRSWIGRRDDDQCTPLHHAARHGCLEAVKWLLDNGANIDAINRNCFTPLSLTEDRDTIALLLTKHPNLKIPVESQTPLHNAAYTNKVEMARLLLENGANADAETSDGETPLALARHYHVDNLASIEAVIAEFQQKHDKAAAK